MRSRLLPLLVVAVLGLTACETGETTPGGDLDGEAPAPNAPVFPTTTTEDSVNAPDDAPARGETGDSPANPDETAFDAPQPFVDPDVPMTSAQNPVVLAFDGRQVPLAEDACTGEDGTIRATTEGEVTITLARQDGVALRYEAEGTTAETDEVTVTESEDENLYAATLSSEQVEPLAVTMAVNAAEGQVLPTCE